MTTALDTIVSKIVVSPWSALGRRVHWPGSRQQPERPRPIDASAHAATERLPLPSGAIDLWGRRAP
jgi:hypothetical protein